MDRFNDAVVCLVGILGEVNTGDLSGHHLLNQNRHGAGGGIQPQFLPVEQGGIGPQRGPDEFQVTDHFGGAVQMGIGRMQAGKAMPAVVFVRGGRTDHDGRIAKCSGEGFAYG